MVDIMRIFICLSFIAVDLTFVIIIIKETIASAYLSL